MRREESGGGDAPGGLLALEDGVVQGACQDFSASGMSSAMDAESMRRYLVGIDVNLAFGAATNGAVGLPSPPVHVTSPASDAVLPGWAYIGTGTAIATCWSAATGPPANVPSTSAGHPPR
ncbi:hypothetical protein ACPMJQ_31915 [Streptomyces pseudogriseolus]|uniref:hypothetical protein n=1 Tax=Streptomyces pseudogriseolus TaxID=36817 RepID=UPI003FA242BE